MRAALALLVSLCAVALVAVPAGTAAPGDEAASIAAFNEVAKVLNHPRCMNCHTNVDWPTVGDDRRRHPFNVTRGTDNRGAAALRCATCHQAKNQAVGVPGAKDWHMAALGQGWTGLTPGAICRALLDPKTNGGHTGDDVIKHMLEDELVLWAWSPGGKRSPPPTAHKDLAAAAKTWIKTGGHCPPQ